MSSALAFTTAFERPRDADQNTVVHQQLLDTLNQAAGVDGWAGSSISAYVIINGHVSITIVPGERPATIFDLRRFREEQKAQEQPEQEN